MTKHEEEIAELERQRDHYKNLYWEKSQSLTQYEIANDGWKTVAQQLAGYLNKLNG